MKRRIGLVSAALVWTASEARADDPPIVSPDVQVKVTETSIVNYHFDNRNDTHLDDKYGEWLNRLNVQATSGRITAAVRFDSAFYFHRPDPNALAEQDVTSGKVQNTPLAIRNATIGYGHDLSTRYQDAVYPSKMFATYSQRGIDVTVGDFYAQLGRGLVLSVRKVDEIAVDTTIRGGKVDAKADLGGGGRVNVILLGGYTNPLRIDEVSGRELQASHGGRSAWFPLMPAPHAVPVYDPIALPNFSPDLLYGGKVEAGIKELLLGVQAVEQSRDRSVFGAPFLNGNDDALVSHDASTIRNASVSLNAPNIANHATFYVEAATQELADPIAPHPAQPAYGIASTVGADPEYVRKLSGGHAVYANATIYGDTVTLTLEGKHYERYFPLAATTNQTEFVQLTYNSPPTTELITSDTQFNLFNTCVTGGRARVDWRVDDGKVVYASVGRYRTYGELSNDCGVKARLDDNFKRVTGETPDLRNDVWDPYVGTELQFEQAASHAFGSVGIRDDESGTARSWNGAPPTTLFYREAWLRYDLVKHVQGPWSVEVAGWHRYRHKLEERLDAWREGENYLSLIHSPDVTAAFGYEYSTEEGYWKHFFNGLLQYRVTSDSVVRAFVGQSRPALRCVSGICRQFPAFEGAKLEIVVRL